MTSYFDSSVLVAVYCLEALSPRAISLIRSAESPLPFTSLHALEIRNALRLKRFRKELTEFQLRGALRHLQDDIDSGFLRPPEGDRNALYCEAERLSAAHTPSTGALSLDLLHVAEALILGAREFVSFDRRQRLMAARAGFKVLPRRVA